MVTTKPAVAGDELTSDYGKITNQVSRDFLKKAKYDGRKGPKDFKTFKKNQVPLTPEERKKVMDAARRSSTARPGSRRTPTGPSTTRPRFGAPSLATTNSSRGRHRSRGPRWKRKRSVSAAIGIWWWVRADIMERSTVGAALSASTAWIRREKMRPERPDELVRLLLRRHVRVL
jgi:hypothetical protein